MKVLVTGGGGVIGAGLIPELLARGHQVRLLSRNADEHAKQWRGVEPVPGDVRDAATLRGACTGCDAVIHVAGIAAEDPPETTFTKVNVDGTGNILEEASRSNVRRFLFLSSLGADRGTSLYHRSKRNAEKLVETSTLQWTIVRPGGVYGPGDEVISNILKMVRTLPAVPVIEGEQPFQPIWYEDLGKALVAVLESDGLDQQTIELAGPDVTTMRDLVEKLREITGRHPLRVPVPMSLATLAASVTSKIGEIPFDQTKLAMLREHNVLTTPGHDPLGELGVTATSLDDGLRRLAGVLPEQLPEDGAGALEHKQFWADIEGSALSPVALMTVFKERVTEVMPIDFAAEPGAPTRIERGVTMTGSLPLRGNFQVRVEVDEPERVVLGTIEGHPLAGVVQFGTSETAKGVRFTVEVFARSANFFDLIAAKAGGSAAQSANWRTVVQRMVDLSGGTSDGVHETGGKLSGHDAERVEKDIRTMVQARKRSESAAVKPAPQH